MFEPRNDRFIDLEILSRTERLSDGGAADSGVLQNALDGGAREAVLDDAAVLPGDERRTRGFEVTKPPELAGRQVGVADEHHGLAIGAQAKNYTISA